MLNKFLIIVFISISSVPAEVITVSSVGGEFHSKNIFRDTYLKYDDCINSGFIYYPLACSSEFAKKIFDEYFPFGSIKIRKFQIELTVCNDGYVADDIVWTSNISNEFKEDIRNMFYSYRWEIIDSGTTVIKLPIFSFGGGVLGHIRREEEAYYEYAKQFEESWQNRKKTDIQNSSQDSSKELNSFFWRDKIRPITLETVVMESGDTARSAQEIMQIVNAHKQDLRDIYNKYFELESGFDGKITLKFAIAHRGDITDISIVSSTTGYASFDNAVKWMVADWKWDSIKKCDYDIATITLNFQTNIPKPFYRIFNYIAAILDKIWLPRPLSA
jgi:hypothetical protein